MPTVALLAVTWQVWMMKMISPTLIPIIALLAVTLHVWMRGKISLTLVPIVASLAVTLQVWMMSKQFACAYCNFTCCHMTGLNDELDIFIRAQGTHPCCCTIQLWMIRMMSLALASIVALLTSTIPGMNDKDNSLFSFDYRSLSLFLPYLVTRVNKSELLCGGSSEGYHHTQHRIGEIGSRIAGRKRRNSFLSRITWHKRRIK